MTNVTRSIPVGRIYLDNENPRHEPIENEPEIISLLLKTEDVKPLAKSISKLGALSPLELVGVSPHPTVKGAYIAQEGNRRVCAIKLLADPEKAVTEKDRKYFRSLAAQMASPIKQLNAVVFESAKAARPWVALRHEGRQKGAGTKPWDTNQTARFNLKEGDGDHPDIQSSQLVDYALENGLINEGEKESISLTTVTRYLSNPLFRDSLGLENRRSLDLSATPQHFNTATKLFLRDALDNKDVVNSRTMSKERQAYAKQLLKRAAQLADADNSAGGQTSPSGSTGGARTASTGAQKRNNTSPDKRPHVVPTDFRFTIHDTILKRLFDELRSLNPEDYSFAATYLYRAVLERLTTLYLKAHGDSTTGDLHKKLGRAAELLHAGGLPEGNMRTLRKMASNKDHNYSPDTIGHFIHGGAVPTKTYVIRAWDSLSPCLAAMFEKLEQKLAKKSGKP